MGLIKAAIGAGGSALGDQWKEYFYCDSLSADVLVAKAEMRTSKRSSNRKGSQNVISDGSIIAVADGQCMMVVDQGKVAEFCAEPGEFIYDSKTSPTIFEGGFGKGILEFFKTFGKRFTFGGETPQDQRVYYFNTKEIIGNKYGTMNPVPFRVVDNNIGLDIDIAIRCNGEFSYKITNPVLFYSNVCGNVEDKYERHEIDSQLKSELLTALQPAFAKISAMGVRYSALPGHTEEIANALNEVLDEKWGELRGIEVASFGVNSVSASKEDEQMIKELQRAGALRNPNMAAATLASAQAQAMQDAAKNTSTGPAMAFMGMNMAQNVGGANTQSLFAMGAQQNEQQGGWKCACGKTNTGNFCQNCGAKKPSEWVCSCGQSNSGKFCQNCGKPAPAGGWVCDCGTENTGKFCQNCGKPRA